MCLRKFGEFKAEVGTGGDIDSLKNTLGLSTVDDLELSGVVASNCATKLCLPVDADTDAARHVSQICDSVETTAQVAPHWFDLSNAE